MKGLLSTEHAAALYGKDLRTFARHAAKLGIKPVTFRAVSGSRGSLHFYRTKDVEWMIKQQLGRP